MSTTTNIAQAIALLSESLTTEANKISDDVSPSCAEDDDIEQEVISEEVYNDLHELADDFSLEINDALEGLREDLESEVEDDEATEDDEAIDDDEDFEDTESAKSANATESIDGVFTESTVSSEEPTMEERNEKLLDENDTLKEAIRSALDRLDDLLSTVENFRENMDEY